MRIAQPRQSPRICLLTLSDEMEGSLSALMFNPAKYMYSGQGRMRIQSSLQFRFCILPGDAQEGLSIAFFRCSGEIEFGRTHERNSLLRSRRKSCTEALWAADEPRRPLAYLLDRLAVRVLRLVDVQDSKRRREEDEQREVGKVTSGTDTGR